MFNHDFINQMFGRPYPTVQDHDDPPNPLEEPATNRREFRIHVTRSSYGELVVVAADTGRKVMPKLRLWPNWLEHCFPELSGAGGWRTRFDGGDHGHGEPRVIVALYYRAEPDELSDHGEMEITGAWALVQIRQRGRLVREYLMDAPWLVDKKLVDDGLEAAHEVLMNLPGVERDTSSRQRPLRVLEAVRDVPNEAQKILRRWANHVLESFGQGPLLPKRRR